MATPAEITTLRRMIDDAVEPFSYTDVELAARIDAGTSPESIAAVIWREKAAAASTLVDVSESGSSRKLSDIRKGFLENAAYYDNLVAVAIAATANRPRTRAIVRPTL